MTGTAVPLESIIDRPVPLEDAWDVADYLMACLTHVTNARPLFGVVNLNTLGLEWTAGGAEFAHKLACLDDHNGGLHTKTFSALFECFGIEKSAYEGLCQDAHALSPGTAMTVIKPFVGHDGISLRVVLRKRSAPLEHEVQFSIMDISAFKKAEQRAQRLAQALLSDMQKPLSGARSALDELKAILADLTDLFSLTHDSEIDELAKAMSARLTVVTERMVTLLQNFEQRYETAHWQPTDQELNLRPAIPVHDAPVQNWFELHGEVIEMVDGIPSMSADLAWPCHHALRFVQNAASLMVVSPAKGRIFALNGKAAEREFDNVDDFVRAIGVEDNSTRTAVEFFSKLQDRPALAVFSVEGENLLAWGRTGFYGGWQAMLTPGSDVNVDVRGLFHGLKNVLLHLQVLYVVRTRADVEQVQSALEDTRTKIEQRLSDLSIIAKTGHRARKRVKESVSSWLHAAKRVDRNVDVTVPSPAPAIYTNAPGEMEDTLEELTRNAFQHGATRVRIKADVMGQHLRILITDNGPGMSDEKLAQAQCVLEARVYDPNLSTRKDGSGNGLLAAANAVSHFVDGWMTISHGPNGKGVRITISLKLLT